MTHRISSYSDKDSPLLSTRVEGDSYPRFSVTGAGIVYRGDGTVPPVIGLSVGASPSTVAPLNVYTQYKDTSIANPGTAIGNKNIKSLVNVGVSDVGYEVSATGSVLGFDVSVVVANTTQAGAEHCPMFAVLRYDQGTGFISYGTPGRGWLTDWTVHGAIGVQQQVLNGINLVMKNYYNGQPSNSAMAACWLVTGTNIGGAADSIHAAATTYPVGVGLGIAGKSSGSARGFDVGIQIGGAGSGWEVASSRVGEGINIRDYDTTGITLNTANVGTARSIVTGTNGGNAILGNEGIVTVSTDFTEARVTIVRPNTAFVVGVGQGNSNHLFLMSDTAFGANIGASMIMGGAVATGIYRGFGYIAGRKTNATVSDSSGYMMFGTHKNGVGMREWLRIDENGVFTVGDAANFLLGTTTGTKFGTATTQKIGFFNATPVVQPSGTPVASTDLATVIALANSLRTNLLALGLVA